MKKSLIVIRWIVGLLFIFSGLIKANDPLGLSYKMQEFFEVWGLQNLNNYTLAFALVMNVFEVLAGVAVIIGWRMRLFSWLLLLLIIFFTFLTGYAYISGNIKTCGCFGDCIPLTPFASFIKDIVLLVLVIILFMNRRNTRPAIMTPVPQVLLLLCIIGVVLFQNYVLDYLPVKDCLPYKKGSNIIESMHVLKSAAPTIRKLTFEYRKNDKIIEFPSDSFPSDFDSTYEFIKRYDKVIKQGTDEAPIVDFTLQSISGTDTTLSVLNRPNYYVMLFVNDFSNYREWHNKDFEELLNKLKAKNLPLFIVTSDRNKALELFPQDAAHGNNAKVTILICDGIVIKTAARVNPTYFIMQLANIKGKYSYKNIDKVINQINTVPENKDYADSEN